MNKQQQNIGEKWSSTQTTRINWWQSKDIIRHINKLVCGSPIDGFSAGLNSKIKDKFTCFNNGISVGCGSAVKEMSLLSSGIVNKFDCFELSKARIEKGKVIAKQRNLSERITFHNVDAFIAVDNMYDFVHWNHSLHHMMDTAKAVKWSHDILLSGGVFYMDDFIGASRWQYSSDQVSIANRTRSSLGQEILKGNSEKIFLRTVEQMINMDPSEAADSENILNAVKHYFPNADITLTGGTIYQLALSGIIQNIPENTLQLLMLLDEMTIKLGYSNFATAIGIKHNN